MTCATDQVEFAYAGSSCAPSPHPGWMVRWHHAPVPAWPVSLLAMHRKRAAQSTSLPACCDVCMSRRGRGAGKHVVFGEVTDGMDIVQQIEKTQARQLHKLYMMRPLLMLVAGPSRMHYASLHEIVNMLSLCLHADRSPGPSLERHHDCRVRRGVKQHGGDKFHRKVMAWWLSQMHACSCFNNGRHNTCFEAMCTRPVHGFQRQCPTLLCQDDHALGQGNCHLSCERSLQCIPSAFTTLSLAKQQSSVWQPALALQHCRLKFHEDGGLGLGLALDSDKMRRHPGPIVS